MNEFEEKNAIKEDLRSIFANYDPSDWSEIKYGELADILYNIKYIYQGRPTTFVRNREVIEFIALLEKLGLIDGNNRRYLHRLKVIEEDRITHKERIIPIDFFVFTDDIESIWQEMTNPEFASKVFATSRFFFEKFEFELIEPEVELGPGYIG